MSSAPASTRATFRSSGDTRSATRTGTRKSAIVRPRSATGTRLSDGIASDMASLDRRRTGAASRGVYQRRPAPTTGKRPGSRGSPAGRTGLLGPDRADDGAGAGDPGGLRGG